MQRRLLITLVATVLVVLAAFGANLVAGNTPNLGLDLQGGASVTLTPKDPFTDAALDVAVEIIRSRVDSLGVAEPEIVRQGDTVVVNLPGVTEQQRAIDLVTVTGEVLLRPVLQSAPGAALTGTPEETPPEETPVEETPVEDGPPRATPTTDEPATDETAPDEPVAEPIAAPVGDEPVTQEPALPADQDPSDPCQQLVLEGSDGALYLLGPAFPDPGRCPSDPLVYNPNGFASGLVFRNDATADIFDGQWVVVVGLRSGAEGRDRWNAAATQCYNRTAACPSGQMAIVLDGEVISAPVVQTPIFDDEVQITGAFSEREARDLAKVLEFGAVPVQFEDATADRISASLGKDSLQAAIVAGIVGILLVLAYLFLYYRSLAIVVAGGLVVFGLMIWSVVSLLSATSGLALTLAGVTGIIVSIGITVDSYIVYFERLKDELRTGRTLRNSAQRGFDGAWRTILVADTVSLIGAGILWYLTVGSVRGFAFFLGLATLCDMIVAYFYTRPAVLLLSRSRWFQGRKVLGVTVHQAPVSTGGAR